MRKTTFLLLFLASVMLHAQSEQFDAKMNAAAQYGVESEAARNAGDISKAIELRDKQLEIYEKTSLKRFYADACHQQAINYSLINKLDEAIALEQTAVQNYVEHKKLPNATAICRSTLASFLYARAHTGDLNEAYKECSQSLKFLDKKSEAYIHAANLMVVLHTEKNELDKAKQLSAETVKMGEKIFGKNSTSIANMLMAQAETYARSGNMDQAVNIAKRSIEIFEQNEQQNTLPYCRLLVNTANYMYQMENYGGSIELLEKAKPILQKMQGNGGMDYNRCLTSLSAAHSRMGNIEKANDVTLQLAEQSVGTDDGTVSKAVLYSKQAEVFALNGNYNQAIALQNEAKNVYVQFGDSIGVAKSLTMLADYTNRQGNSDKATELCNEAIAILQRTGSESKDLANAYNAMSIIYNVKDDIKSALDFSNKAADACEHVADTASTFYAQILSNMAIYSSSLGMAEEAINYAKNSYRIQCKVLGENHPQNVAVLFNIANIYHIYNDRPNLEKYFHKAVEMQKNIVRNNFTHLTTQERERYWNDRKYVFDAAPYYTYQFPASDSLIADAYDSQLLTKGILLNSEIDFRTMMEKSGNNKLHDKYTKLFELNKQIDDLYKQSDTKYTQQARQLQRQAEFLEHDIMKESKEFGDYTRNMNIGYKDIAASLGAEDVAVELLSVPQRNGTYVYMAMYLRKDWKAPKGVFLFNSEELNHIYHEGKDFTALLKDGKGAKYVFNSIDVGRMVWDNLINRMNNDTDLPEVRNIYFSPSSLFYQWGIEYLTIDDDVRMCERYNMYRLSSTKIIAQESEHQPITTAAVFGGIDYDIDIDLMRELHGMTYDFSVDKEITFDVSDSLLIADAADKDRSVSFEWDDELETDGTRAGSGKGFGYLPGTMNEASQICTSLMEHNVHTFPITAEEATEENFKAMDGKHISMLHIATHGFNFAEGSRSRNALDHLIGKPHFISEAESSMGYSGLIMAGANNVFGAHIRMPKDIEDGVLTSKEISAIDLSGLELAVLSACQTGLGDIKGDGVFGLQRGLKKAGARTLLMSLWNVSDKATQIMMTSFYTAMLSGASRHDAFLSAQQQLRDQGFSDPYYWAAFILLDDM